MKLCLLFVGLSLLLAAVWAQRLGSRGGAVNNRRPTTGVRRPTTGLGRARPRTSATRTSGRGAMTAQRSSRFGSTSSRGRLSKTRSSVPGGRRGATTTTRNGKTKTVVSNNGRTRATITDHGAPQPGSRFDSRRTSGNKAGIDATAEEVTPPPLQCFHCSSIARKNGKSLYPRGWKPKTATPIIQDCWKKPKEKKDCIEGCAETTAIGPTIELPLVQELRKSKSTDNEIRMIIRACKEDIGKMIKSIVGKPFQVPYSNCTYVSGQVSILGKKSRISTCYCDGNLCNGVPGVVYNLQAGTCRVGLRYYSNIEDAPRPLSSKRLSGNDKCATFCKKNQVTCENAGFKPQEFKNSYCLSTKNADACNIVVSKDPSLTLPPTTIKPGTKSVWVFCEVCD